MLTLSWHKSSLYLVTKVWKLPYCATVSCFLIYLLKNKFRDGLFQFDLVMINCHVKTRQNDHLMISSDWLHRKTWKENVCALTCIRAESKDKKITKGLTEWTWFGCKNLCEKSSNLKMWLESNAVPFTNRKKKPSLVCGTSEPTIMVVLVF